MSNRFEGWGLTPAAEMQNPVAVGTAVHGHQQERIRKGIAAYQWRIDKLRDYLKEPRSYEDLHRWMQRQVEADLFQPVRGEPLMGDSFILGTMTGGEFEKWLHLVSLLREVGDISAVTERGEQRLKWTGEAI